MNKEPKQGAIRTVPEGAGPMDGVELMANCTITTFKTESGEVKDIAGMGLAQCKLMASYETGTVSVSVRGEVPFMVSVRLDEMMALLHAAAGRRLETQKENTNRKEGTKQ